MHCLEVIVARNQRAAAREEAEAAVADEGLANRIAVNNGDIPFSVRVEAHRKEN